MKHMTKKALALLLALLMAFPTITLAEVPDSATAIEAAQAMDAPVESPEEAVLSAPEADSPDESEEETDVSTSEVEAPAELAGVFELGPDGPEASRSRRTSLPRRPSAMRTAYPWMPTAPRAPTSGSAPARRRPMTT